MRLFAESLHEGRLPAAVGGGDGARLSLNNKMASLRPLIVDDDPVRQNGGDPRIIPWEGIARAKANLLISLFDNSDGARRVAAGE